MNRLTDTIYSRVTDTLREAILNGEYKPGQQLKMKDLVERLGTSQMPIRESLQQLKGEGLIRIIPQRGAQVITMEPKFVKNICDLRYAVEMLLVKEACEITDLSWVSNLKKAQDLYDSLIDEKDSIKIIQANRDFHKVHYDIADNSEALGVLERTNTILTFIRTTYGYSKARILQTSKEHKDIIEGFEKGDREKVIKAASIHLENAKKTFLEEMEED